MKRKKEGLTQAVFRDEMRREIRLIHDEIKYVKKHLDKIWEYVAESGERLQDLEVQMNLMSRLVSALAIEKMNMRLSALRRMIRKVEKEAINDYQIKHLEDLYRLDRPTGSDKKLKS